MEIITLERMDASKKKNYKRIVSQWERDTTGRIG